MTILEIPDKHTKTSDEPRIRAYLSERGILFERWSASAELNSDADEEAVLGAYEHVLRPYMQAHGYQTADVIRVHSQTQNIQAVRKKFLDEHTHSEDEVRFFVEGKGMFWFNLGRDEPVFSVLCEAGDLLGVPAGIRHWFDMGAEPMVTAIRVFTNQEGWVPEYTNSGISQRYNRDFEASL